MGEHLSPLQSDVDKPSVTGHTSMDTPDMGYSGTKFRIHKDNWPTTRPGEPIKLPPVKAKKGKYDTEHTFQDKHKLRRLLRKNEDNNPNRPRGIHIDDIWDKYTEEYSELAHIEFVQALEEAARGGGYTRRAD